MKSILNFIIVFGVGILFATVADAAGFDCSKAGSADEKIVCGDSQLSRLDELFNQRYAAQKKAAPDEDTVHVARNFLADRRDCADDRSCILSAYLAVLWNISPDKNDFMQGISAQSLAGSQLPEATAIPAKAGHCATTSVLEVHPRLDNGGAADDADFDSGTGIDYANDGYQVSYNREEALIGSKPGDPVTMCLVEIDRDCSPDEGGKLFLVTNGRTGESWILPDAQHKCGG
ncbi:conserved hypothetical protein [Rhizobium leguminosarum bv. trifolii WSM2304]|uniref:DUF1311 domain-containing protein n=1 Tax=Rhizobium leguminosarum bv. trifolii (strain WSM2304) TaxID=395492 RepID=A0ABF7QPH8_RHILW|nr:hypothetical protein [Rhizobium leguminosarum]ACI55809.1 conserved hypothetical protein [Rhizobium leguminosarum bv. trifolii WSM2304]